MRSLRLSGGESGPYSEDVHMADSDHHAEEDDSHRDDIDERDDDDPSLSVTGRLFFSRARIPTEKKKKIRPRGSLTSNPCDYFF